MKKRLLIIILVLTCFIVEGVFIFKGGNEEEAKLNSYNFNEQNNESNEEDTNEFFNDNENPKAFKWEVSDE